VTLPTPDLALRPSPEPLAGMTKVEKWAAASRRLAAKRRAIREAATGGLTARPAAPVRLEGGQIDALPPASPGAPGSPRADGTPI
jgi:hypothetical protein